MTWKGTPIGWRTGASRTSSAGGGKLGARYQSTCCPPWIGNCEPPTWSPVWSTFVYQNALPVATCPPIPQTPRPKPSATNLSVSSSGLSRRRLSAASTTTPSAFAPCTGTPWPEPLLPAPKQSACGLVGIVVVSLY